MVRLCTKQLMCAALGWHHVVMTRRFHRLVGVAVIAVTVAGCMPGVSMEAPTVPKVLGMAPPVVFAPQKPPGGLYLESVVTGPASSGIPAAVYGVPGDSPTGRMVAAFRYWGAWDNTPRDDRRVHLEGKDKARSGGVGDMTWIAWLTDPHSPSEEIAAYDGIVGRGLSATEIHAAAKELTGDREHVRIGQAGVPKGLRLLSSQPIPRTDAAWTSAPGERPFPGGTRLTWSDRSRGAWLALDLLGHDAVTEAWARVFAPEGYSRIRGTAGAVWRSGTAPQRVPFFYEPGTTGGPVRFRVWQEKDTIALVSGVGVSQGTVDDLVTNLRPAGQKELEALRLSPTRYPPAHLWSQNPYDRGRFVTGGNARQGTWAAVEKHDAVNGRTVVVVERLNANGTRDRRYGKVPGDQHSPLALVQGQYPDILIGRALRQVKRVRFERADGSSKAIRLGDVTASDGMRWFTNMKQPGRGTLIAYDAAGKVLERTPVD